jgi:hypothetical protein
MLHKKILQYSKYIQIKTFSKQNKTGEKEQQQEK